MAWDRDKERKAGKAMTMGSCVFGLIFAIFWCIAAVSMGAGFMLIFGIPFVGMMIYRLYVLSQMTKEEPKQQKETDPWERPNAPAQDAQPLDSGAASGGYCPYCGSSVQEAFEYCPKCGRRLK